MRLHNDNHIINITDISKYVRVNINEILFSNAMHTLQVVPVQLPIVENAWF